jgi:hypothetical protein
MKKTFSLFIVLFVVLIIGCGKESETLNVTPLSQYYPLQVGKTYLYRLDSTLPASFGSSLVIKSYQAKDSIESTFNDNSGRLSYRIYRFVRDTAGLRPWQFAATYVATPTNKTVEYVDNNLRFIKLTAPVTESFSWKGNSFIDTKSLNTPVSYLDEWEYQYQDVSQPFTVFNKSYDSTVTVLQQDETTPNGPFNPALEVQIRTLGLEVYAKNVGLVYKEFLYWNWQKNPGPPKFIDGSYGVKLRLISHN